MSTPLQPGLNLVSRNTFHVLKVEEIQDTPLSETKLVLQPEPTTTTPILDPKPILHESIGYNALEEDTREKLDIKIMLKTVDTGQAVSVKALLDSGATGLFLDDNFVKHMGWKVDNIEQAVPVYNVDGTWNKQGAITHYTWKGITITGSRYCTHLLVTLLGNESIILRLPWL